MTREEIARSLRHCGSGAGCEGCPVRPPYCYKMMFAAADLLEAQGREGPSSPPPQREEKNEPLTLEELREMDGEPVYLETGEVSTREQLIVECEILIEHDGSWFYFTRRKAGFWAKNYGKTWLAYRREPDAQKQNEGNKL